MKSEALDEGMRTSSCLGLTKTFFQASRYDVCSRSAADRRILVFPPSLFFHHFLILAYSIPQPLSVCRCHSPRRDMHKKLLPSRSTTATQGCRCMWFVHDVCFRLPGHDRRHHWHAEVSGCILTQHAPGSLRNARFQPICACLLP